MFSALSAVTQRCPPLRHLGLCCCEPRRSQSYCYRAILSKCTTKCPVRGECSVVLNRAAYSAVERRGSVWAGGGGAPAAQCRHDRRLAHSAARAPRHASLEACGPRLCCHRCCCCYRLPARL